MSSRGILIVTKFGYRRGGAEAVAIDLARLLHSHGWRTAIFAMDFPANAPASPDIPLFTAPEVSIDGSAADKARAARRILGGAGVGAAFRRALREFSPDIVHFHNIHSYLSPEVVRIAAMSGVPTVWTLHDYKLICPAYTFLRAGKVCEECLNDPWAVVRHRCMKRSLAASLLARAEAARWSAKKLQRWTDAFICPSRFMATQMEHGGYNQKRIHTLCNFTTSGIRYEKRPRRPYFCYAGRLSPEKGIDTLLHTVAEAPLHGLTLKVAGDGPMARQLHERYGRCEAIEFLGQLDVAGINTLLSEASFCVVPSEWYENNPLSVIESLSAGTPVAGAAIGGIPELIGDGDGILFEPGDAESLHRAITTAAETVWDHDAIAARAAEAFSPDRHYRRLTEIYRSVIADTAHNDSTSGSIQVTLEN